MPTGIANELSMFATWWLMVVAAFNRLPTSPCGYQYDCLRTTSRKARQIGDAKEKGMVRGLIRPCCQHCCPVNVPL